MSAAQIKAAVHAVAQVKKAKSHAKYFQAHKGGYGEGDYFLGVTVPDARKIARDFLLAKLADIQICLQDKFHEVRLVALLILSLQAERNSKAKLKDLKTQKNLVQFYLKNRAHINNWDLIDGSAPAVLGPYFFASSRAPLLNLAKSKHLWDRRIAILTSYYFIRHGDFEFTVRLCKILLRDPHDLIHKATGWMLREIGKRDLSTLRLFLSENAAEMPRTMLRYSIEKLPQDERQKWLRKGPSK